MHHARGKSNDHADCIARHLVDRGTLDTDGLRHSAKVAWRALALLQEELEAAGAPLARGAKAAAESAAPLAEREHISQKTHFEPGLYAVDADGFVTFTKYTRNPVENELDALKARTIPR
jgi:hypothetical protein